MTELHSHALPDWTTGSAGSEKPGPRRVGMITSELLGFHLNGGIGTAYTHMAEALAEDGHDVHVVLVSVDTGTEAECSTMVERYREKGVTVHPLLFKTKATSFHTFPHFRIQAAFEAYTEMYRLHQGQPFDIIHASDWYGLGLDCLRAKHLGRAFEDTFFVVGIHSPTMWIQEAECSDKHSALFLGNDVSERASVELADMLWSPSQYLLDWVRSKNWKLPDTISVMPYLGMDAPPSAAHDAPKSPGRLNRLVFFGRLEVRKGLHVFLEALEKLSKEVPPEQLPEILFMGKSVIVSSGAYKGHEAKDYISDVLKELPYRYELINGLKHEEAMSVLQEDGTLAVMPSLIDNSPNTVYECLLLGIPFVASRTGGIPELIHPDDLSSATFPHNDPDQPFRCASDYLSNLLLHHVSRESLSQVRAGVDFAINRHRWREWHLQKPSSSSDSPNIVSETAATPPSDLLVCVSTAETDIPRITACLDSLKHQSCSGFGLVFTYHGVETPEIVSFLESLREDFEEQGWSLLLSWNSTAGDARQRAVTETPHEHVLFLDEQMQLVPHAIGVFLEVQARSGSNLLVCGLKYLDSEGVPLKTVDDKETVYLPLPFKPTMLVAENCKGELCYLVRRSFFLSLGGFEHSESPLMDWRFLTAACLEGEDIGVIPELLVDYRVREDPIGQSPSKLQTAENHLCDLYKKQLPSPLQDLPKIIHDVMQEVDGGFIGSPAELQTLLTASYQWSEESREHYATLSRHHEELAAWWEQKAAHSEGEKEHFIALSRYHEERAENQLTESRKQEEHLASLIRHYEELAKQWETRALNAERTLNERVIRFYLRIRARVGQALSKTHRS